MITLEVPYLGEYYDDGRLFLERECELGIIVIDIPGDRYRRPLLCDFPLIRKQSCPVE